MSTDLLYHGFGIRGYIFKDIRYEGERIIFEITQDQMELRCSLCGSGKVNRRGEKPRTFRMLPIGSKSIELEFAIPRLACLKCGVVRQVKVSFADERRTYTKSFERYALELSRISTIKDVAEHLGVSWDVVKDIQKRHLKEYYADPKLNELSQIAIDEIAVSKGHKYLTVVLDLESGAIVFVGDGKGMDALAPFWEKLKRSGADVKAVATDMSPAYIQAVTEHLPGALLVFDRFHVMKIMNEKLSELRRRLHLESTWLGRSFLRGVRWLLLKNVENLDESKKEQKRLQYALEFNEPLAKAYFMKEQLRLFWEQKDKETARVFLDNWCQFATDSKIKVLMDMSKTLRWHRYGLLNWYDYPISTGPLEGVNNKIKTMKRQAYGYRDLEFFKLKIYALHKTKYALVG